MTAPVVTIRGRAASPQDAAEFARAKTARGERVRMDVEMGARADALISDRQQYAFLRSELREVPAFARASEELDRLESAFVARWRAAMPLPRELKQNQDGTIGLVWPGLVVAAGDGLVSIHAGRPLVGARPELLDAIASFIVAA